MCFELKINLYLLFFVACETKAYSYFFNLKHWKKEYMSIERLFFISFVGWFFYIITLEITAAAASSTSKKTYINK